MQNSTTIGIDLGGTHIRAGLVSGGQLSSVVSERVNANGTVDEVLQNLYSVTDRLMQQSVNAIGIGVPGLVDLEQGIVYDVNNIPSWKEVPLRRILEEKYKIAVHLNNDANCFALGEYYFGKGKSYTSMVGLALGTGLGSGIIINGQLYNGTNGGAGEFGMMPYLDQYLEYYCSGQFFTNVYQTDGIIVFEKARAGNTDALQWYKELGRHIGEAIKIILYTLDVPAIILGGSVRHAFPFFKETMWQQLQTFAFTKAARNVIVEVSELHNSGLLGAASLYNNSLKQ